MCLAIPMKIIKKEGDNAVAQYSGVERNVNLSLTPDAKINDYVIIHAGFAISILDQQEAKETLELIKKVETFEE